MAISGVTGYTNTYAAEQTKSTGKTGSDTQEYLSQLKAKYPDVNITVADFKSERQSNAYMLGSRGYNNLAVSPDVIRKMASDPSAAEKYEGVFEEMSHNSERIEKFAKENNDEILGAGAVIDKNGKVSYWMVGRSKDKFENPGTVYKDKIQQQIKERREKKKEEEAAKQRRLEKSETMEKLLKNCNSKTHEIKFESNENVSNVSKYFSRNNISKLENAIEDGLKNHPPKIIQAEEKEIEIIGDIMTEKMKRLEKQLKDGTFKANSDFDVKA